MIPARRTPTRAPILAQLVVAFLFPACGMGSTADNNHSPADLGAPDLAGSPCTSADTFQAAQKAMLSSCGGAPRTCHVDSPYSGSLDLKTSDAYASLVGVAGRSFLVQKLTDMLQASEGQPMPLGEGIKWHPPDPTALTVLRCWIALGAANN
jgi:hypothetical protein